MIKKTNVKLMEPQIFTVLVHPCEDLKHGYWAECNMPNGGCITQEKTLQKIQSTMIRAVKTHLKEFPEISNYYLDFKMRKMKRRRI